MGVSGSPIFKQLTLFTGLTDNSSHPPGRWGVDRTVVLDRHQQGVREKRLVGDQGLRLTLVDKRGECDHRLVVSSSRPVEQCLISFCHHRASSSRTDSIRAGVLRAQSEGACVGLGRPLRGKPSSSHPPVWAFQSVANDRQHQGIADQATPRAITGLAGPGKRLPP